MKKAIVAILLGAMVFTGLTGCGSKDPLQKMSKTELIDLYNTTANELDKLGAEYEDYKSLTKGIQSENEITAAISITGDGTGRYSFNVVQDSKIIFPQEFMYPESTTVTGDGCINIVDGVTIRPSTNWICKLNGSTLELENTDAGISGTIKVGHQNNIYEVGKLKTDVMAEWFKPLPPSQVNYTNISVGKDAYGVQATTPTRIASEDAFLRCGMLAATDKHSIVYIFVYRGQEDSSKNESITSLLNSITLSGQEIIVEQR